MKKNLNQPPEEFCHIRPRPSMTKKLIGAYLV